MPQIPAGWKETTLGEVSEIKGGKRLPKGDILVSHKTQHPYIRITDFENHKIKKDQLQYITDEVYKSISRYIVNTGDVILSIVGSIGFVAYIDENLNKANLTENCVKVIHLRDVDPLFLYYFLISNLGQNEINKNTVGAVQKKLPIYGVQNIRIHLPPLPEQQAIAAVLSSFDDKIELLRAENQTLEQMGQELFKERFGKWKVGDELPEGWRVGKLGEIAEITNGKRPSEISDTRNSLFEIPLIGATKIMGYVQNFLFDGETLVIGRVGTHGEVQIFYEKIHPSDNTLVIKSNNFYFTYFILKSIDYEKINRGAVQPLITQSDLKNYLVILPDQETLSKFDLVIKPLFNKIRANSEQTQTLSATRDQLLPKLMSGEVRVEF